MLAIWARTRRRDQSEMWKNNSNKKSSWIVEWVGWRVEHFPSRLCCCIAWTIGKKHFHFIVVYGTLCVVRMTKARGRRKKRKKQLIDYFYRVVWSYERRGDKGGFLTNIEQCWGVNEQFFLFRSHPMDLLSLSFFEQEEKKSWQNNTFLPLILMMFLYSLFFFATIFPSHLPSSYSSRALCSNDVPIIIIAQRIWFPWDFNWHLSWSWFCKMNIKKFVILSALFSFSVVTPNMFFPISFLHVGCIWIGLGGSLMEWEFVSGKWKKKK